MKVLNAPSRPILFVCLLGFASLTMATPPDPTRQKFDRYYAQWREQCEPLKASNHTEPYVRLPAFRAMVSLGAPALPFLREKLEQQDSDFMLAHAVAEICGWKRSDFQATSEPVFRDQVLEKMEEQNPTPTPELARRYRQYRRELRKDSSTPHPELRRWGGPCHATMSRLGQRLASEHPPAREVLSLLGAPDKTLSAGDDHHGKPVPPGQTYLIYWWRGGHDYLFFVVEHDRIVSSDWWHAWE